MSLKKRLTDDMKQAMREKDKLRLGTIRLINAAIKQKEVDERITLSDEQATAILEKMLKQRRDSIKQYTEANRQDLADAEQAEVDVIKQYMPTPLTDAEIDQLLERIMEATGAQSMQDMGKVMGQLKQQAAGRVDMSVLSSKVKARLNSN